MRVGHPAPPAPGRCGWRRLVYPNPRSFPASALTFLAHDRAGERGRAPPRHEEAISRHRACGAAGWRIMRSARLASLWQRARPPAWAHRHLGRLTRNLYVPLTSVSGTIASRHGENFNSAAQSCPNHVALSASRYQNYEWLLERSGAPPSSGEPARERRWSADRLRASLPRTSGSTCSWSSRRSMRP